jgi:hypothetical protein
MINQQEKTNREYFFPIIPIENDKGITEKEILTIYRQKEEIQDESTQDKSTQGEHIEKDKLNYIKEN